MEPGLSAQALATMSLILAPVVMTTLISHNRALRAVRGSHQRWLWGGIYRLGLIAGMLSSGALATSCILNHSWLGSTFFGFAFGSWAVQWYQWSKMNDDDFWNSLGRRLKGLGRSLVSSLRPSPTLAPARR